MAMLITIDCVNCNLCELECPNEAISPTENAYIIDPGKCTECVGHFERQQCVQVCPADCIIPDPDHLEEKNRLRQKYLQLTGAA
jgi:ferredoxin